MDFEFIELNADTLPAYIELQKIIEERGLTDRMEISRIFKDLLAKQENLHKANILGNTTDPETLGKNIDKMLEKKKKKEEEEE